MMTRVALTTILLQILPFGAFAQLEVSVPYNPDGNADGLITLPDMLDFLALYGGEYSPETLATDSSSAIIHMGQGDYFDCASSCAGLEGNWKIMDEILVGRYKDQIQMMTSNNATWMDRRSIQVGNFEYAPMLNPAYWNVDWAVMQTNDIDCICQTRVIQPIVTQTGPCQGNVDLCGICDGPGPVYECGCFEIADGACDCEGNQLDALGVCGGNCLGDFDSDGICDSYPPGACANEESITYNGFEYALVEIGGQCWFVDDLRTSTYANGDTIAMVQESNSEWEEFDANFIGATGASPGYEYNGSVYNWHAVLDSRGLCPGGWKVPSRLEYETLVEHVASSNNGPYSATIEYENVNRALKDDQTWNGSNEFGFTGTRTIIRSSNGSWVSSSTSSLFHYSWTSTYSSPGEAFRFRLAPGTNTASSTSWFYADDYPKGWGHAVRCIKDTE